MVEKNLTAQPITVEQCPPTPRADLPQLPRRARLSRTWRTSSTPPTRPIKSNISPRLRIIAHSYKHLRRSDIERDLLFAEIDGEPIGYGRCMWDKVQDETNYYTYSFFVHLHPDWRGKGIGKAMAAHLINRIEEITQITPANRPNSSRPWAAIPSSGGMPSSPDSVSSLSVTASA